MNEYQVGIYENGPIKQPKGIIEHSWVSTNDSGEAEILAQSRKARGYVNVFVEQVGRSAHSMDDVLHPSDDMIVAK